MGKPIKGLYTNDWEQHKQNANLPFRAIHLLMRLPLMDVAYRRGRGGGLQRAFNGNAVADSERYKLIKYFRYLK